MDVLTHLLANSSGISFMGMIVIGFFAFAIALFYYAHVQAKKRTAAMSSMASSLDMSFDGEKRKPMELGLHGLGLFERGRSRKAYNIMQGRFADTDCMLFDYKFTVGSGKNSSTHIQTVVVFKVYSTELPSFTCKPEHFFHKFADAFGFKDIDFDEYPKFSKRYRLNGDDEHAVRSIFNSAVIEQLESESKRPWSIDGAGQWLVIHRAGMTVKVEECSQFLLDSTTLLNSLTLE